ncbi:WD40 repeat domain-containing protein [Streptomyces sp. SP18CS02]|uniref:WD40 repeat domain-containing protein n=1 Tax=Streptomyces sp. SP18CS02 TaxID=3002531 RepID=UPI002E7A4505|nr:WD40 repeat domain-containing protein [Streptomyces sp. SP18CS02]MEE1753096.1 WD40 repeat domain-containing protein [Streptomyces sp. SP18CS02]
MDTDEITLVHPGFPKPKNVRLWVDGGWLRRESRTGAAGTPRQSGKDHGSPDAARCALAKEGSKRMHDGFVLLRDPAEVAFGEPVLICAAPNRCSSAALDLHPEGHTVVVGTTFQRADGAEIHLIDVRTGIRQLVHTEPPGTRQTFLHTVRFDADGRGVVYALNGHTRYLDLDTGTSRALASYEEGRTANFNPFRVQPSWDRARSRLLVFDTGDRVRVLDDSGEPLLDLDVTLRPSCRAGALSPSGRLLALAFDMHDIEVWDVDSGRRVHRHPFPFPFDRSPAGCGVGSLGFDPTERYLIANGGYAEGPCLMALDTGRLAWAVPDPSRTDRWGTCYGWSFSPDGFQLAAGDRGTVCLRDAATGAKAPVQPFRTGTGRTHRVVFSDSGELLACGGDSGSIVVLRAGGGPRAVQALS